MSTTSGLLSLEEILQSGASVLTDRATLTRLDELIESSPALTERDHGWKAVAAAQEARGAPSGHAHFRLGILHLVNDVDETLGISHLEKAHAQDLEFEAKRSPYQMAAYRVLSLVRDFIAHLRSKKNWQTEQL